MESDEKYWDLLTKAIEYKKDGRWEDAAHVYLKAAQLADTEDGDLRRIAIYLVESANCYRNTLSEEAFNIYKMSINAYIEYVLIDLLKNNIGQAIAQAVECGYIYEREFGDLEKSNDFYDQADDLRVKVGYEHICEFPDEYMLKILLEISYALNLELEVILYLI
ncbi:hypothetical protein RF11_08169 [Thelohanellus kitauei]|uniref:Gamma-soluble NSF attachment protein n=1 Tax=Thelohanellus kitauei TaxID=669202 RepID=A0A0C2J5A1_THEKT|nr:hypothetical protein RF11_08169 [Thelohanellus kitauei]